MLIESNPNNLSRKEEKTMLDPRSVIFERDAFRGKMILIGISDAYAYAAGKRTDEITSVRCNVVLPDYNYERLAVKLPINTTVDKELIGNAVDFVNFAARIYMLDGRIGISATATAVVAAT